VSPVYHLLFSIENSYKTQTELMNSSVHAFFALVLVTYSSFIAARLTQFNLLLTLFWFLSLLLINSGTQLKSKI